jgi:hypothetical protein
VEFPAGILGGFSLGGRRTCVIGYRSSQLQALPSTFSFATTPTNQQPWPPGRLSNVHLSLFLFVDILYAYVYTLYIHTLDFLPSHALSLSHDRFSYPFLRKQDLLFATDLIPLLYRLPTLSVSRRRPLLTNPSNISRPGFFTINTLHLRHPPLDLEMLAVSRL